MLITVFTPTYNRAKLLSKAYSSLLAQSSKDFEWIVIDDGSSDNTREMMDNIIQNHQDTFSIQYFYKENGGKHTAINNGLKEARGELFFILDSDDSLPKTAIADIIEEYKSVRDIPSLGGVSGLVAHHNGERIGSGYPDNCEIASSIEQRFTYNVKGDLAEVFKISVLREYPFPEIENERFCPEQLVWFRIAQKYKLKCFNKVISYRDYLDGGLTDNIVKIRMKSPIATMMTYAELASYNVPFAQKIKAAINYWRFRFCAHGGAKPSINPLWLFVIPVAFLLHIKDNKMVNG